ncbi:MAG: hypothetical protein Q9214_000688 [Letrouitia sp. 1 TL-2023]
MRLFLVPISTHRSLIYCQRLNRLAASSSPNLADRITARASATWLKWEKSDTGWQKKVTAYGNKLLERIPYEEWGLKSTPPLSRRRREHYARGQTHVEVEFPGKVIRREEVWGCLRWLAGEERQAFHAKWMWGSMVGMPVTAPMALVPVVPNIPFFYLVFRAWSHWRARSGSKHIEFLLSNDLIKLVPSTALDLAYQREVSMKVNTGDVDKESSSQIQARKEANSPSSLFNPNITHEAMLIKESQGGLIADETKFPELEEHIVRAVKQVEKALRAKKELKEEKEELDHATKDNAAKR